MDIEVIKGNILAVIDRHTNLTKVNEELHVVSFEMLKRKLVKYLMVRLPELLSLETFIM